jgi:hypothetical protein
MAWEKHFPFSLAAMFVALKNRGQKTSGGSDEVGGKVKRGRMEGESF